MIDIPGCCERTNSKFVPVSRVSTSFCDFTSNDSFLFFRYSPPDTLLYSMFSMLCSWRCGFDNSEINLERQFLFQNSRILMF
jgi:hypothetical protein